MNALAFAFKYLTGQFALQELVESVTGRIGIKGRAIIWDHAEPCMDVDKPHQLEIMRADIEEQQRKLKAAQKKAARSKAK